jgi:hypothetical protein
MFAFGMLALLRWFEINNQLNTLLSEPKKSKTNKNKN